MNFEDNISQQLFDGDRETYIRIFKKYYKNLCVYAFQFVKDKSEAEEVVQETFIRLWENRGKVKIEMIDKYLYKSVRNNALNKLSKMNRSLILNEELTPYNANTFFYDNDILVEKELIEHINEAIDLLPGKTKEVFIMSRHKDMKHEEIAHKLNITKKGVEYHITKALRFLNDELKDFLIILLGLLLI